MSFKILKISSFFIIVLGLTYWGYYYMNGFYLFKSPINIYHTYFENVQGLSSGSNVTINGYNVGQVNKIELERVGTTNQIKVRVTFGIQSSLNFSELSKVALSSDGLMGGRYLAIVPSFRGKKATNGQTLGSIVNLGMIDKIGDKIAPIQKSLLNNLRNIDSLTHSFNSIFNKKTQNHLQNIFTRLDRSLGDLNDLTSKTNELFDQNQQHLTKIVENTKKLSDSLAQIPLSTIGNKLSIILNDLNKVTKTISKSEGTLGKIIYDPLLYNNLNNLILETKSLISELKQHPKRFVHFSLFGKKPKPYQPKK